MMREALLFVDIIEKIDRDIYTPANYRDLKSGYRLPPSNSGNKLWLGAVEQYICQDEVKYSYYDKSMKPEEINGRFEYILAPMANLINSEDRERIKELTLFFKRITIPVYIVGLGAQAKTEKDIEVLIKKTGDLISSLMDSILSTGGKIGLRGEITKEILSRLGFDQTTVIGCPSMFINGSNYTVNKKEIEKIKPIINGDTPFLDTKFTKRIFDDYPEAVYIDQETFAQMLYGKNGISIKYHDLFTLIHKYSYEGVKLFSEDRIKLFFDIPVWMDYIAKEQFNFCLGTRIHGNIISVLSGIPSIIIYKDLRVLELAEYLCIPCISEKDAKDMSLPELYDKADYTKFNQLYNEKYNRFKYFFDSNKIANSIGDANNTCFSDRMKVLANNYPPELNREFADSLHDIIDNGDISAKFAKMCGTIIFRLKHI